MHVDQMAQFVFIDLNGNIIRAFHAISGGSFHVKPCWSANFTPRWIPSAAMHSMSSDISSTVSARVEARCGTNVLPSNDGRNFIECPQACRKIEAHSSLLYLLPQCASWSLTSVSMAHRRAF